MGSPSKLTPEEAAAAVAEHGSIRAAGRALGVDHTTVLKWLRRAAPELVLKGQSTLTGPDGEIRGRWDKTTRAGRDLELTNEGPDPLVIKRRASLFDPDGKVIQQWITEEQGARERLDAWMQAAELLARKAHRAEPLPPPEHADSSLVTLYPVADAHMGMLSWKLETGTDYDLKIGRRLLTRAMSYLTRGWQGGATDEAVVALLGDTLHYDSYKTVTPEHGHLLDADSRYPAVVWRTVEVMRTCIDLALRAHRKVTVVVKGGNHDDSSSVWLALALKIAYENEPRIEVRIDHAVASYLRFGKVLLGFHHGDKIKPERLPGAMAADVPQDWGASLYRYWWTGHIHRMTAQDFQGCTVESARILPPPDAYAAGLGYRSPRDAKAIIYHLDHGEVARHTVNPSMMGEK